jgi:hypothetical protein
MSDIATQLIVDGERLVRAASTPAGALALALLVVALLGLMLLKTPPWGPRFVFAILALLATGLYALSVSRDRVRVSFVRDIEGPIREWYCFNDERLDPWQVIKVYMNGRWVAQSSRNAAAKPTLALFDAVTNEAIASPTTYQNPSYLVVEKTAILCLHPPDKVEYLTSPQEGIHVTVEATSSITSPTCP